MWLEMEKERRREKERQIERNYLFSRKMGKSEKRKAPAVAGYLATRRRSLSREFASPEMQRQFFAHPQSHRIIE